MIKELAKQWLTRGHPLRDYVPVGIARGGIAHRVTLCWGQGSSLDISDRQWTLGYNPVMVGVALPAAASSEIKENSRNVLLRVTEGEGMRSSLELKLVRDLPDLGVLLFQAVRAEISCLDPLRRELILRRLHRACLRRNRTFGELTPTLYRQYVAQFCYPRRVVVACALDGETPRAFPIDLHGYVPETEACLLGIRHSNLAVQAIQASRRVVICEVPATQQATLYELGKFAGKPAAPVIPMSRRSERLSLPIPDIAAGWREIRVVHDEDIGAQRLFGGFVEAEVPADIAALHHLHLVAWLAMAVPYSEVGPSTPSQGF